MKRQYKALEEALYSSLVAISMFKLIPSLYFDTENFGITLLLFN